VLGLQPGQVVLDLGCGNGDDVRELAQLVGPTGRVVGVDRSETLIATARERLGEEKLPVEFQVGDAYGLDFPNEMFDGCRADRVFHHMEKPEQGMAELVRVARSGARVVTIDPDFETATVDAPDPALTRTLLNLNCDSYRNGRIGRHMRALFMNAGLVDVAVEPLTVLLEDYALANQILALEGTVTRAKEAGLVNAAEGARWLANLQDAGMAGRFFGSLTAFIVAGRKSRGRALVPYSTSPQDSTNRSSWPPPYCT
jgi:ubiquinone/menaquinone biosynthesis C-methylase UbiE